MHMPLPSDDPQQRKPDISLARKMLNDWEPTIQLRDGLVKTIAYFEDILSRGASGTDPPLKSARPSLNTVSLLSTARLFEYSPAQFPMQPQPYFPGSPAIRSQPAVSACASDAMRRTR